MSLIKLGSWILAIGSLIGGQYVIYQKRRGYLIWIIVNILWIAFYINEKIYASAFLFLIYLIQSVFGFFKWENVKKHKKRNKEIN